jgi:hypothetical protein
VPKQNVSDMQWYRFNLTGVDHLAECPHMVDTPDWPACPWGKPEYVTKLEGAPENPCQTCLASEDRVRRTNTYDGLSALERFAQSRSVQALPTAVETNRRRH